MIQPATTSIFGTFQPDTLTTGVAPCRSAEFQVTVSVCDSPGNSVMSLPCQIEDCSSLSPDSSWPPAVPRRTSARSRNATVDGEVLVIVTVVSRSAPSGPAWLTVVAVAVTDDCGSVCSAGEVRVRRDARLRLAQRLVPVDHVGLGGQPVDVAVDERPVLPQQQLDEVDLHRAAVGTFGVSTLLSTCWLASVMLLAVWSSSTVPARL